MRIIIAVAVMTFGAVAQIASSVSGSLDIQKAIIAYEIILVQNKTAELRNHQYNYFTSRISDNDHVLFIERKIKSKINQTLQIIENVTNNSTAEGKDASDCYETARCELRGIKITMLAESDDCFNPVRNYLNTTQNDIDSAVQAGQRIISYLNSIFLSCYTTSTQKMKSCIVRMLRNGMRMAESFRTTAEIVLNNTHLLTSGDRWTMVRQLLICISGTEHKFDQGRTTIELDVAKCIAALL